MGLKIVIGGGTGFIGQALTRLLKTRGHSVVIVSRQSEKPGTISWERIRNEGLPESTDAVVSVTGTPIANPLIRWSQKCQQEIYDSRLQPNQWLKNAILLSELRPKVWVSISGVGYYAASPSSIYDEDSAGGQEGYLGKLAKQWEEVSKLPPDCEDVRYVCVRAGAVLGKDGGAIKSMMWPFRLGLGGPIGNGKQWFPWIHIDDMAGILAHAIENENVAGILNGVAPAAQTNAEFTQLFAKALHRPAFFRVPAFALNLMLGEDSASVLLEGQNVMPKRTLDSGYKFIHPELEKALQNIVL